MPYSRIQQYGIAFIGLPAHLEQNIGTTPRKPALYGSAKHRELWQSFYMWSLGNNLLVNSPTDANPVALEPISDLVSSSFNSNSSILNPSSDSLRSNSVSMASVSNPFTSNLNVSCSLYSNSLVLNP